MILDLWYLTFTCCVKLFPDKNFWEDPELVPGTGLRTMDAALRTEAFTSYMSQVYSQSDYMKDFDSNSEDELDLDI